MVTLVTFLKHQDRYISYMSHETLDGEKQFRTKKCLLEMTPSHAKRLLKSAPEKLSFVTAKAYEKLLHEIVATNAFARFVVVAHSYVASISRKVILCQTNNIFYSQEN